MVHADWWQQGAASRAALEEQSASGPKKEEDEREEDDSLRAEASSLRRLQAKLAQCDMSQLDRLLSEQCELYDRDLEQSANAPIAEYEEDDSLGTEAFDFASRHVESGMSAWYRKHLDCLLSEVCEMVDCMLEQRASEELEEEGYEEDESNGTEVFDGAGAVGMKASAECYQWPGHVYGEHVWVDFRLEQLAAREEVSGYEEDDSRGTEAFD